MLAAVTFDYWNTVMWERSGSLRARRLELWTQALAEASVECDPADLEAAHDAAHFAYEDAWRAGTQYRVEDAAAQVMARLGGPLPDHLESVLLEGYSEAGRRAEVHASDGIHDCLAGLRDAGIRLGIVCDIGLTPSSVVRELLARDGLLELFDFTAFSDETGWYKPSPEAFRAALRQLGDPPPDQAAHVGDRRRTDIAGAQALGMIGVRYTGVYDDPAQDLPDGDHVIDDLRDLPAALGVGAPAR